MYPAFREEFSWRCFTLRFHKTEAFFESQWRWPRLVFVVYRLLMSVYSIFAFTHMAVSLNDQHLRHHFMVYLTNWTYLVEMVFFFWGALLAISFFFCTRRSQVEDTNDADVDNQGKAGVVNPLFNSDIGKSRISEVFSASAGNKTMTLVVSETNVGGGNENSETEGRESVGASAVPLPWYVQVYWVLSSIIQDAALVVTVTYFLALYSPSKGITLLDMNVHGVNSLMILIDVILCARPVRLLHMLYPALYGLAYVIFSAIYWSHDHQNVLYPNVLDWNQPGLTCGMVFGLELVGIPLLQLLHYGIYRLRLWCHHRIYGESYM